MAAIIARRLRPSTLEEVRTDYEKLKEIGCTGASPLARTGLTVLDHFFLHHRIKAKTRFDISFYEALKDPAIMKILNEKMKQLKPTRKKDTEERVLRLKYDMFQLYYGTINQFRPTEAMKIYCRLKPSIGILDFSAGWGGRCLAAMALGIPYTGIDANVNLEKSYRDMIDMAKPDAKVNMIFKPSETVDFSRFKYDLVFTSPPYFMIEVYEKMPSYDGKIAFLDTFFRPVVEKAWKSLAIGGHMALNMPVEMYEAVRRCLAPLATKLELALAVRHAGSDRVKKPYREYIYVWKKLASKRSVTCKRGNIKGGVVRLLTRKQPTH
jgi:hypothetical protein